MKKHKFADGGIYTAEMGQPPMEPDGGSVSPAPKGLKKPPVRAGMAAKKVAPKPTKPDPDSTDSILSERVKKAEEEGRDYGRKKGQERQEEASGLGGVLGTPAAYVKRAGQYIGDKFTDADAYLSEKTGMKQRAAGLRGERRGLKEEGYAKGGSVSSASKRADGCATKGKTKGRMV